MNRQNMLRFFAGVIGLMLAWALVEMEQRDRPRDQAERPLGPSAVEETGQSDEDHRGPMSDVQAPGSRVRVRTKSVPPRPVVRQSLKGRPAKHTAHKPSVKGRPQQHVHVGALSPGTSQRSAESAILPVPDIPQAVGGHLADEATPIAPPPLESRVLPSPPPIVLKPPVLLTKPAPQGDGDPQITLERGGLTTQLRLEAPEGLVVLRILVGVDGTVARAEIARSSGQDALDRAAVLAAQTWRFDPATRNGEAIEAWVLIPVRFVVR